MQRGFGVKLGWVAFLIGTLVVGSIYVWRIGQFRPAEPDLLSMIGGGASVIGTMVSVATLLVARSVHQRLTSQVSRVRRRDLLKDITKIGKRLDRVVRESSDPGDWKRVAAMLRSLLRECVQHCSCNDFKQRAEAVARLLQSAEAEGNRHTIQSKLLNAANSLPEVIQDLHHQVRIDELRGDHD